MGYFSDLMGERFKGKYTLSPDYEMALYLRNHVVEGGIFSDGGSTTHADATALVTDFDHTAVTVVVNGVWGQIAAGTVAETLKIDDDSPIQAATPEIILTLVVKKSSANVFAADLVMGAPAAATKAVAPTAAEIDTKVTHKDWIKLCDVKVTRSSPSACTEVFSNNVRPVFNGAIVA